MSVSPPEAITRKAAEALLGVHPQMFQRALDRGCIPTVDVDGKRLIVRAGLEDAWANRKQRQIQSPKSPAGRQRKAALEARRPAPLPTTAEDWPTPPSDDCPGLPAIPATTPNLEDQRAWVEFEKRYKIKRENMTEDGKLVYKDDIVKAMSVVLSALLNRAHGVARQVRLQLPHLTGEDMVIMDRVVLSIFEEVSNLDYENLRL